MKKDKYTILVVEDSLADQILIVRGFQAIGVTDPIHAVSDGSEAIAYMMGEGKYSDRKEFAYPSFIMTDLKMPKQDGFAVLEHLKNNPEWAVIPTIVFTASSDPDDIKTAYRLGASSYHVKPSGIEALRKQLKILYDYWMTCEVPEITCEGKQLGTESKGKLGERYAVSEQSAEAVHTR